ncbi:MAG: hypothetical protein JWM32_2765 [Verrucomicrobia bacterium]|nr:hypothetical protein [Verrucomicrobiota bacterium]
MPEAELLPLAEWESFYVIVGSSAAALTGLQFVVIALGADKHRLTDEDSTRAFGTPTVVHFCAVLLVAAILSTPRQTPTSLAWCFLLCGIVGLAFIVSVIRGARRQQKYQPVREDWIGHAVLPAMAYAALVIAGAMTFRHVVPALFVVAATEMLLLFTSIHNAWDAAAWLATRRPDEP